MKIYMEAESMMVKVTMMVIMMKMIEMMVLSDLELGKRGESDILPAYA